MKIAYQSSSSSSGRIDALDGLRAMAILLVLLHHFTPNHNSDQGLRSIVFKIADLGWSGVDLFFVLSGFLITGILLRAKASNSPLRHFLMRRILRILPAYYLALGIIFLFLPFVLRLYPVPAMSAQAPYWFYVANMLFPTPDLGGCLQLTHFWSLAVEMQFYVLWPLVIYQFSSDTVWKVVLAAFALVVIGRIVAVIMDVNPWVTIAWTPFRADGLIVGSLIAVAVHAGVRYERVRSALLVTLVAGFIFALVVTWFGKSGSIWVTTKDLVTYPVLRVSLPCALSLLYGAALWISLQRNLLSAFLGSPIFKPLALYSYGTYIFHFLLSPLFKQSFGPQILVHWTGGQDVPIYLYFVLASSVSFALAMASYHLVEVHFLRLKRSVSIFSKPLAAPIPQRAEHAINFPAIASAASQN
jgi:peptidoglycan/LPS O-acetylase OafA/YrhL